MIPPASSELRGVKVLDFKTSVLGNLVPFLKQFLPAIRSGHAESSGSNPRLAIGSAIVNVNNVLGHKSLATVAYLGFRVTAPADGLFQFHEQQHEYRPHPNRHWKLRQRCVSQGASSWQYIR